MSRGREVLRVLAAGVQAEAATLLALAGAGAVIYGTALLSPAAAWIVAGGLALAIAIVLARKER